MAFTTIRGEGGIDVQFTGTENVDVLFAINEVGTKLVEGKESADNITLTDYTGVVGTATVLGGAGDDTITIGEATTNQNTTRLASSNVKGGAGEDLLTLRGAIESTVRGNEGADTFELNGNYTASVINGNAQQDVFSVDVFVGQQNQANLTLENSKIVGGKDNDVFDIDGTVRGVSSTINGNAGNDSFLIDGVITATNFTVFGGQGDDFIQYNADSDGVVFSGDKGDDEIITDSGNDIINGGEGDDNITAFEGKDTIDGGSGNDTIDAGADDDVVVAGEGNDTIAQSVGTDTITGGAGADTVTLAAADDHTLIFTSQTDSAAAITGSSNTFDSILGDLDVVEVDFQAAANQLAGTVADAVIQNAAVFTIDDQATGVSDSTFLTFADLKTEIGTGLVGSVGDGTIKAYIYTVDQQTTSAGVDIAGIEGTYVILADTNDILTTGDMMFEVDDAAEGALLIAAFNDSL